MNSWRTISLILLALALRAVAAPVASSEYAASTLVVYNQNSAESRELAAFYAKARGIPLDNIVGLDCPADETIKREVYEKQIAAPLRKHFDDNHLWQLGEAGGGVAATSNKIHILALMRGVPLRIAMAPLAPTGEVDENGKPVPPKKNQQQTDEASVDSELTVLGMEGAPTKAMLRNPYFRRDVAKSGAGLPAMMLVGRIDGPNLATAKRLIEDAIATEKSGLWGSAYIDLAKKGGGYKIGDDWLLNAAKGYGMAGIPTYVDVHPQVLPPKFPLGDDVILYFGWYTKHASGPFADPGFRFKRGAVACHIHSYSATTLHSATRWWCGPLLARGAAATLGNVYEPFLTATTHLDLFNSRLLQGYTFVEAAWMATPVTSWMSVVVGDPLYQPYSSTRGYAKVPDADFKAMRLALGRWRDEPDLIYEKFQFAADKMKSPKIYEAIGLRYRQDEKFAEADEAFEKASQMYTELEDQLRMELFAVEGMRSAGKKAEAIAALRKMLPGYQGTDGATVIQGMLNQLDPPPPPPPPPVK